VDNQGINEMNNSNATTTWRAKRLIFLREKIRVRRSSMTNTQSLQNNSISTTWTTHRIVSKMRL